MNHLDSKLFTLTSPKRINNVRNVLNNSLDLDSFGCDNNDKWNNRYDTLLSDWLKKGKRYRCLHTYAYEYYMFWHYILSIPILVISTGIGMTTFAFVSPDKPTNFEYISQYIVSFFNLVVAILSGILQLSKCSEFAIRHQRAAIEYTKFYRSIQMEISLAYCHRSNPIDFCRYKRMTLDKLLDDSLQIPKSILKKIKNTNHTNTSIHEIDTDMMDVLSIESFHSVRDDQSDNC